MAKTATTSPEVNNRTCACGCGEPVARLFKQGHDQVLVSKLAQDIVQQNVWDGKCLGILTLKDVKGDIEDKINKVANYVGAKLSPALSAKFDSAARRQWDLAIAKTDRAKAKADRKATNEAKPRKVKAAKPVATPSEEAGDAPAKPLKLVTATATNDDVDAAEGADATLGATVTARFKVGRNTVTKEATVTGMNQAGKVTAIEYAGRGGKLVNKTATEGFEIIND